MSSIAILRLTYVTWGLLCLLLAFIRFTDISMLGFPDGYISPYDTATKQLQEVLAWLVVAQGAYFLLIGVAARGQRPAVLLLQIFVSAALVFVPTYVIDICPRWDTCTSAYQSITGNFMDDGTGG
jgi:uncharacterized membrane protein